MATEYTVADDEIGAHAKTLVANDDTTVTFADDLQEVEVVTDGAADLYVTVDNPAPTVADQKAIYLPASPCKRIIPAHARGATVVRLISAGTPKVSVARPV